jgi:hypothetical protein
MDEAIGDNTTSIHPIASRTHNGLLMVLFQIFYVLIINILMSLWSHENEHCDCSIHRHYLDFDRDIIFLALKVHLNNQV